MYDLFALEDGWNNSTTELICDKFMNQKKYDRTEEKSQTFTCDNAGISLSKASYYVNYSSDVKGVFHKDYLEITFEDSDTFEEGNFRFYQSDCSSFDNFKANKLEAFSTMEPS